LINVIGILPNRQYNVNKNIYIFDKKYVLTQKGDNDKILKQTAKEKGRNMDKRANLIKKFIFIFVLAIIAIVIFSLMIKYNVEGENNMPFEISKVMVISTATGKSKEGYTNKWDLELMQNNDIYIEVLKNNNYLENEVIEKVIIDNFETKDAPIKGELNFYRPSAILGEEYKIEKELVFLGNESTNLENLQIANQGDLLQFRCINENLGSYISNEDTEIKHDGTLLAKVGIKNKEITFSISFDVSIELKSGKRYKTNINLELPTGNLIEQGTTNYQIDKNKIIFKRY